MFNRRFTCCIVALVVLFISGVGYRVYTDYKGYVETEKLMKENIGFLEKSEEVSANRRTLDKDRQSQQGVPTPAESNVPGVTIGETKLNGETPQSAVKVRYASPEDRPKDLRSAGTVYFNTYEMTTQYVETPDGKVHRVLRPPGEKHKIKPGTFMAPSSLSYSGRKVTIDGITYNVPEEEDVDSYINKIHLSSMYDVPIEDVGRLIAEGLIPNSPIEAGRLFDDDHLQAPIQADSAAGSGSFADSPAHSEGSPVMGESKSPVPPAHVHHEDGHVHHGEKYTDEPPTAENIERQLGKEVSPERFSKAQKLIDQYGTEEGLRRLREMDPEAARQFESDKSRPGQERRSPPTREIPDEAESSTQ